MKTKYYNPSINILRDFNEDIEYIVTPNSAKVYGQIASNYHKGSRSFSLIGSYGTGKSSFIIALEQSLKETTKYFDKGKLFDSIESFKFFNIVGENESLISTFAERFRINIDDYTTSDIFSKIDEVNNENSKQALVIIIDEFGKFLEYASKNNPERELYFIQQLAEYANDKSKDVILISVLHQNFNAYALELSQTQVDEWNKVKGRLVELNFNEPVEQILFLASKKISEQKYEIAKPDIVKRLQNSIEISKLLPILNFNSLDFSIKLYPFDLLSVSVLTFALQEYAQNERSLFSFISNDADFGFNNYENIKSPFYNIACVYDYLNFYHNSFLSTKYNPHLNQWNSIKDSIERIEMIVKLNTDESIKLIKTIGLLNIFSNKGGVINDMFIECYGQYALGINNTSELIEALVTHKIIRFSNYDNRYKILKGTDLDFELAINEAGKLVEKVKDVSFHLNNYFDFPIIPAKEVSFTKGTPRLFSFILSEEPTELIPKEEIDGYINLIFNRQIKESKIQDISSQNKDAVLYGLYNKPERIEDTVYEIEKIKKVIEINSEDLIALNELQQILNHYRNLLNHFVIDSLYNNDGSVVWYFKGERISINSHKEFNNLLSQICIKVYSDTPIFRNELVNKTKISGTVSSARKKLFSRLLEDNLIEDIGFNEEKYPPEKTIFLSLIRSTGIFRVIDARYCLTNPTDSSFGALWDLCISFLENSIETPKPIEELISLLKSRPFKLKQGFIDFWLPLFLLINKDDFALYSKDRIAGTLSYIPYFNSEVIELINKSPKDYLVKKFDLTDKKVEVFNKYREVLNQIEQEKITNISFIETFKPFLFFYKSLNTYSRVTSNLSSHSVNFREAIGNAIDPEQTFFIDFPKALGYTFEELSKNNTSIENFAILIKECIQEIDSVYDRLINDIESFINIEVLGKDIDYPQNKIALQDRYKKLKSVLLKPKQKVFYQRIVTVLDDRKSWISSICQVTIGKSLELIKDEEINSLKDKILNNIRELDNYTDLSLEDINPEEEEVIKLEVTSFLKGLSKNYIRIPKNKYERISTLEKSFKKQLKANDKTFNIALLTKLLQEELKGEDEN